MPTPKHSTGLPYDPEIFDLDAAYEITHADGSEWIHLPLRRQNPTPSGRNPDLGTTGHDMPRR